MSRTGEAYQYGYKMGRDDGASGNKYDASPFALTYWLKDIDTAESNAYKQGYRAGYGEGEKKGSRGNPGNYIDEIRRLRKAPDKSAAPLAPWCFIDSVNGPEPYSGTMMHLAHLLLTKTDIVDFGDNLLYTGDLNPWIAQKPSGGENRLAGPAIIWRAPVYQLTTTYSINTCTSVFSATSKMQCASFSLPAGPPNIGGSCPQAYRRDLMKGLPEDLYICRNCYSIQGKYGNANVQLAQAVTLAWVKMLLAEDDGGETFARTMIGALGNYLVYKHKEMNPRYFRIHDSGDMGWNFDYFKAWVRIAAAFEGQCDFWAPTRDHNNPKFAALVARTPRPANLVIRPSALHFQTPAPRDVVGFDAGSTSAYRVPDLPDPIETGLADFNCPAYSSDEHTCESGIGPDGKRPCRACWTYPHLTINYQPHKASLAKRALAQRRNPAGLSDDDLTDLDRADAEMDIPLDLG